MTFSKQQNEEYNLTIYATDNNESTYIESRLIATTTENYKPEDINPIILEQNPIYIDEVSSVLLKCHHFKIQA